MGIGIGSSSLLVVCAILLLFGIWKLKQREPQNQDQPTQNNHSKEYMELSVSTPSPYTALSVNPTAKQGKGNSDEYDEVVSPTSTSTAGQYETMPPQQADDQDHIYNKI